MLDKIASIIVFIVMVTGPFYKAYLIGEFSISLQSTYLLTFFVLQFVIPICNTGLSWQNTRRYIEEKDEKPFYLSYPTILLLPVVFFAGTYILLVYLLAVSHSCINYYLQIKRLEGRKYLFMSARISKVLLDVSFLTAILYKLSDITIVHIILLELTAVLLIISVLSLKYGLRIRFPHKISSGLNRDFLFVVLRVIDSNYMRLMLPFLFPLANFQRFFFVLVGYEYVSQFIKLNFIRNLLDDPKIISKLIIFIVITSPFQYFSIYAISYFYGWEFSQYQISLILVYGCLTIISLLFVTLIKHGRYNFYFVFILIELPLGLALVFCSWALHWNPPLLYLVMLLPKASQAFYLLLNLNQIRNLQLA